MITHTHFAQIKQPSPKQAQASGSARSGSPAHADAPTIKLRATASGFVPKNITIPPGKMVMLVIDTSKAPACAKQLEIRGLSVTGTADDKGSVMLHIPAQKPGSKLRLQCSMAMLKADISVSK